MSSANETVTIATPVGHGENPEEKMLPVAKRARIVVDGNESSLAFMKVIGNGRPIRDAATLAGSKVGAKHSNRTGR